MTTPDDAGPDVRSPARNRRGTVLGTALAVCLTAVGVLSVQGTTAPDAPARGVLVAQPSPAALQTIAPTTRASAPTSSAAVPSASASQATTSAARSSSSAPTTAPRATPVPSPGATTSARPATTVAAVATTAARATAVAATPTGPATLPAAPAKTIVRPESGARAVLPAERFGAVGDGVRDDTVALQKALDSIPVGSVLQLRAGATYRHSDVLRVTRPDITVSGPGATVLATNELRSAFHVDADRVEVTGVTFALATSTERFHAYEQMKVRVSADDVVLRDVRVQGAAAAGVYVGNGSARFLLDRVQVTDSRADGIHVTGGARDGRIVSPVTTRTGDDGVAVVSYKADGVPCARIAITSPVVNGTTWGRGISVVGGDDVSYTNVRIRDTDAAAVYLGSEGDPYYTFPSRRVLVSGGTVSGANDNAAKDHGAVLVYAGHAGTDTRDITVQDLTVTGTRSTATWNVGVLADPGSAVNRVALLRLSLVGGPALPFYTSTPAAVRLSGLKDDGVVLAGRSGW